MDWSFFTVVCPAYTVLRRGGEGGVNQHKGMICADCFCAIFLTEHIALPQENGHVSKIISKSTLKIDLGFIGQLIKEIAGRTHG